LMTLTTLVGRVVFAVTPSPAPTPPGYDGNADLVTPGVVGFIAIFLIAVITVFLLIDMNRRIRRTRYREEIRDRLAEEAEQAGQAGRASRADQAATDEPTATEPPTATESPK
ncbi:MAG: hypothetical protein QOI02_151, partial [Actinomycetota bacterium]|nr:hypothetical protein [Actinomycetota bacterium]